MEKVNEYIEYLVGWLQEQVEKAGVKGLIVGVSGGVDSAVVANLIKQACPNDCLGLIMPIESKDSDVEDALAVVNSINMEHVIVDLNSTYQEFKSTATELMTQQQGYEMAFANSKARLRMMTLYAFAQNYGYLVVGTDNAVEWLTGYFTKYGDGGVDIAPLIHLKKSEVYELAKAFGVPSAVIEKAPSAGLIGDMDDETELQVTYEELEAYMDGKEVSEKAKQRIEHLHKVSAHKRDGITKPELKVSDL